MEKKSRSGSPAGKSNGASIVGDEGPKPVNNGAESKTELDGENVVKVMDEAKGRTLRDLQKESLRIEENVLIAQKRVQFQRLQLNQKLSDGLEAKHLDERQKMQREKLMALESVEDADKKKRKGYKRAIISLFEELKLKTSEVFPLREAQEKRNTQRRIIIEKRNAFQDTAKNLEGREKNERAELQQSHERSAKNLLIWQELNTRHVSDERKEGLLRVNRLMAQQLREIQRKEAEQLRELQHIKAKFKLNEFDSELEFVSSYELKRAYQFLVRSQRSTELKQIRREAKKNIIKLREQAKVANSLELNALKAKQLKSIEENRGKELKAFQQREAKRQEKAFEDEIAVLELEMKNMLNDDSFQMGTFAKGSSHSGPSGSEGQTSCVGAGTEADTEVSERSMATNESKSSSTGTGHESSELEKKMLKDDEIELQRRLRAMRDQASAALSVAEERLNKIEASNKEIEDSMLVSHDEELVRQREDHEAKRAIVRKRSVDPPHSSIPQSIAPFRSNALELTFALILSFSCSNLNLNSSAMRARWCICSSSTRGRRLTFRTPTRGSFRAWRKASIWSPSSESGACTRARWPATPRASSSPSCATSSATPSAPLSLSSTCSSATRKRTGTRKRTSTCRASRKRRVRTSLEECLGASTRRYVLTFHPFIRYTTLPSASELMCAIVNDVLDFAKIEARMLVLEPVHFNVISMIQDLVREQKLAAKKMRPNIEVKYEIGEGIPNSVVSDPVRIRQVLLNLVSNAMKFTFQGSIVIILRAGKATGPDTMLLEFCVKDTGVGIDKENLEHIFAAFSQAKPSITREFGGTGLGLSISKSLVERLGGKIGVSSEKDKGTSFTFTIKVKIVSDTEEREKEQEKKDAEKEKIPFPKGIDLLIVEDSATLRRLWCKLLIDQGCIVDAAGNGQEALDKCAEKQ